MREFHRVETLISSAALLLFNWGFGIQLQFQEGGSIGDVRFPILGSMIGMTYGFNCISETNGLHRHSKTRKLVSKLMHHARCPFIATTTTTYKRLVNEGVVNATHARDL